MVLDVILIYISLIFTTLILNDQGNVNGFYFNTIFIALTTYLFTGQYKGLMKYIGTGIIFSLFTRNVFVIFLTFLFSLLISNSPISLQKITLLFFLITNLTLISRLFIREIFKEFQSFSKVAITNVVIYGAGKSGAKLASTLKEDSKYNILFFVDDSPNLWKRAIYGINIYPPKVLKNRKNINQIHIAIPSLTKSRRKIIVENIQMQGREILEITHKSNAITTKIHSESLKPVKIETLLGREVVPPIDEIIEESVKDMNICISGAGGSIGSELCKQIVNLSPKKLVLIDNNELALYNIINELNDNQFYKVKIIPKLGSVTDPEFIKNIFDSFQIDIIFHAAAYKHVPLVESCPIEGLKNNILSSYFICKKARDFGLKKAILISTDKAVRPSNVMGASKRIAELIFQAFSILNSNTIFSMVRFGNVLGSSGSVVPLFQKQINNGGPVTLTDQRVLRYFMTISEAVQLVLHASVLAKGGEVFLLDMGDPVPIKDLAEEMIKLSGLTIKNKDNPNGDIEIRITGLRAGEKLFEELLIDGDSEKTSHPLIFKANESMINYESLIPILDELVHFLEKYSTEKVFKIVKLLVPEWKSDLIK